MSKETLNANSQHDQYFLAIDSASEWLACALARVSGTFCRDFSYELVASADAPAPRCANEELIPRVEAMLIQANVSREQIAGIICGRGPGSFTGVRIGVAVAKGLALGLGVPLYGVSTLDAVAWNVHTSGIRGYLGVLGDAMRKEVYPVLYNLTDAGPFRINADFVTKPDAVLESWRGTGEMHIAGDALHKFGALFEPVMSIKPTPEEQWVPSGAGLFAAFVQNLPTLRLEPDFGDPARVLPVYTRLSDAEENERMRLSLNAAAGEIALAASASGVAGTPQAQAAFGAAMLTGADPAFRPMATSDINQVALLDAETFAPATALNARLDGGSWSANLLENELTNQPTHSWWVAVNDGEVCGYCGVSVDSGEACILRIAVKPAYRRRGIATYLFARIAEDAFNLGAATITLEVRESNSRAQALYKKLGLESQGVRPNYYGNEGAVIMRGSLPLKNNALASTSEHQTPHDTATDFERTPVELEAGAKASLPKPCILALESSCDETAAAVIDGEGNLLCDIVASQIDFHARFGGVVPEIASRKHIEAIYDVAQTALTRAGGLANIDAVAVTYGPGLIGALVVGVAFAKGLAFALDKPLIGVNHLEGHLYANRLANPAINPPLIASLISGGNTMLVYVKDWGDYQILGETLDDAVGEAFDKVAKAMGLGYPGGPVISRLAAEGDPDAIDFPRAMLHSHDYKFSLSGLKTAVMLYIKNRQEEGLPLNAQDIAASFQKAVVDVQVAKAKAACLEYGVKHYCLGGGVAANKYLANAMRETLEACGIEVTIPPISFCGDNAAMIAAVARDLYAEASFANLHLDATARLELRKKTLE